MEKIYIWNEEELVDFILGWDFSSWEWGVADENPEPDVYPITVEEILRKEPISLHESDDSEWWYCDDPYAPWAIHRDAFWTMKYMVVYFIRQPWGKHRLKWRSTHATREEAEEELRSLLG